MYTSMVGRAVIIKESIQTASKVMTQLTFTHIYKSHRVLWAKRQQSASRTVSICEYIGMLCE